MHWKWAFCLLTLFLTGSNSKPLAVGRYSQANSEFVRSFKKVKISDNLFCKVCKETVELAEMIFGSTIMNGCLPEFITYMCTMLEIEDKMICKGMINGYKDVFLYVLNEILKQPANVCGLLEADCDDANINPLKANWSIQIPPNKPEHSGDYPPKKGRPSDLKVLHISDIHIDMSYAVGSEVKCSEPQCCRMPKNGRESNKVIKAAGYWGSVGNCDTPIWTLESMLKFASENHDQIDYIVISGDLESHADWEYSREEHQESINEIFTLFHKYFNSTRLFFSLGNHEGVPINNVAPHYVPERFHMDWLYKSLDDSFGSWLDEKERKTLTYNGCYMAKVGNHLRLLALNNIFGDSENFFLFLNQSDPDGTMTWLSNQLLDAEKAGDKVQILAHIPGGDGEMFPAWALNYYNLVNRFEDTIVGQFMGHTHSELFYLTFEDPNDSTSRPTSVIYSAPSVTTYTDFNPAYRVYTIDGERPGTTYKVIDWEEWYLDIEQANKQQFGGIDAPWMELYDSIKDQYNINYVEPEDWYQLAERFLNGDPAVQTYVGIRNRRFNTYCDHNCQQDVVCSIFASQKDRSGLCKNLDVKTEEKWPKKEMERKLEKIRKKKIEQLKIGFSYRTDEECPIKI